LENDIKKQELFIGKYPSDILQRGKPGILALTEL
jgi:hypothetical protein